MKYFILFTIVFPIFTVGSYTQSTICKFDTNLVKKKLNKYELKTDTLYRKNKKNLVCLYSFRSMVQKDYSKITIGDNSVSKVGRYASLKINSDESKFYFTPILFVKTKDPYEGPFKYIHSIDFSGDVNSSNIFDFKSKNSLKGIYSFTFIHYKYSFTGARDTILYRQILKETHDKVWNKYKKASFNLGNYLELAADIDTGNIKKFEKNIKHNFFDQLKTYEENCFSERWTMKNIGWFKITAAPLSFDYFSFIDADDSASFSKPLNKKVYTPDIKVAYNHIIIFPKKNDLQIYGSFFLSLARKHSLSEISKPSQWYSYQRIADSTVIIADEKNVFTLKDSEFKTAFCTDFGFQFICLLNIYKDMNMGIDISLSFHSLVAEKPMTYSNTNSIGLIFPFLDKDGKSTINIEVFYQFKRYHNISIEDDKSFGIKFGLPFNIL